MSTCEETDRPSHNMLSFSNSSFFCIDACNILEIDLLATSYIFNTVISIQSNFKDCIDGCSLYAIYLMCNRIYVYWREILNLIWLWKWISFDLFIIFLVKYRPVFRIKYFEDFCLMIRRLRHRWEQNKFWRNSSILSERRCRSNNPIDTIYFSWKPRKKQKSISLSANRIIACSCAYREFNWIYKSLEKTLVRKALW